MTPQPNSQTLKPGDLLKEETEKEYAEINRMMKPVASHQRGKIIDDIHIGKLRKPPME